MSYVIPKHFTDEQKSIIESTAKFNIVTACPGSGKTTMMVETITKLINQGVSEEEILWLSFTRSSIDDVKQKLEKKVQKGDKWLNQNIRTFHSFCVKEVCKEIHDQDIVGISLWRVMKSLPHTVVADGHAVGHDLKPYLHLISTMRIKKFTFHLENQDKGWEDEYMEKQTMNHLKGEASEFFKKINKKDKGYFENEEKIMQLYHQYETLLKELDVKRQDFPAIMNEFINSDFKSKFKYIFVDELQDINYLQKRIILKLSKTCTQLYGVGDPSQSIYSFRHSLPNAILDITKDLSNNPGDIKKFELTQNFRCSLEICCLAEGMQELSNEEHKSEMDLAACSEDPKQPIHVWGAEIDNTESNKVIMTILKEFYSSDKKKLGILTDSNWEWHRMSQELQKSEEPFLKEMNWYRKNQTSHIPENFWMKWVLEKAFGFQTLNQRKELVLLDPWGRHNIQGIQKPIKILDLGEWNPRTLKSVNDVSNYLSKKMEEICDAETRLRVTWNGIQTHTLQHFVKSVFKNIQKYKSTNMTHKNAQNSPFKLSESHDECYSDAKKGDAKNVHFSTIHNSKGLEYDWVIFNFKNLNQIKSVDNNNECIRCYFIALTRAKDRLYLAGRVHMSAIEKQEMGKSYNDLRGKLCLDRILNERIRVALEGGQKKYDETVVPEKRYPIYLHRE